MLTLLEMEHKP